MTIRIVPMDHSHLEAVGPLTKQLGYAVTDAELLERFQELSASSLHQLLVLEENGVKGWMHLELVSNLIRGKQVEIKALVVEETERSKGYGHALVEAARNWAKTNQVRTIYLSCNIIRDKAHAFYLREGFNKIKTSHLFELKI